MSTHRWINGKCECGCEQNPDAYKGRGARRTYSFDGFKTILHLAPPCTRPIAILTKAERRKAYMKANKKRLSGYAKAYYYKKKMRMFEQVLHPTV